MIGIIVFVGGSPRYKHAPPSSSVLGEFGQIVYTAGKRSGQGKALLTGIFFMMFGAIIVVIGYFVHNETAHLTLAIGGMIHHTILEGSSTVLGPFPNPAIWEMQGVKEGFGAF